MRHVAAFLAGITLMCAVGLDLMARTLNAQLRIIVTGANEP